MNPLPLSSATADRSRYRTPGILLTTLRTHEEVGQVEVKLHVFRDNDSSYTGQAAAFDLARRLTNRSERLEVVVNVPDEPDTDWLDVLVGRAAA